jgi:hypothetical protein
MYEKFRRGLRNPEKVVSKFRQCVGRVQNKMQGCDFTAEDWDNLLILDACRYDMFERLNNIPGNLESRRSNGSATREFVRNTFVGKTFHDTVYVTANPFVSMDVGDVFHATIDLWRNDWNDDLGTVKPEVMRQALLDAAERYPNKRLIAHFIQPHHPFIGPTGQREINMTAGNEKARRRALGDNREFESRADTAWLLAERGDLDVEMLACAYNENLELVLPEVRAAVDALDGLTVVTSDHGNLMDEPAYGMLSTGSRRFAHPMYATAPELVRVPWLVCEADERRHIHEDSPQHQSEAEEDIVEDRLEALGYA